MGSDPLAQRRVGRHEQDAARAEHDDEDVSHKCAFRVLAPEMDARPDKSQYSFTPQNIKMA